MAKKRFRASVPTWQIVGLAVLAVLALAAVVLALNPAKVETGTARPVARPVSASPSQTPKPMAVFLGDSYTQGTGSSAESKRWADLVSAKMGWAENNLGRGGTGYVATSDVNGCGLSFCPNYPAMVDLAVADKPSIVVVAGGQNDFTTFINDPSKVTAAINSTFSALRAKLPNAQIIAVGPSSPWGIAPHVRGLDQAVQTAARAVNAKYVSLIDPNVVDPAMVIADKAHVNDAGHAAIAERVEAALR